MTDFAGQYGPHLAPLDSQLSEVAQSSGVVPEGMERAESVSRWPSIRTTDGANKPLGRARGLSDGHDRFGEIVDRAPVVPRHPAFRARSQLAGMSQEFGQVVEGIDFA